MSLSAESHVVCWSYSQNWLKIETMGEHLKANLDSFMLNQSCSMALLGVFETHEEARLFCEKLNKIRSKS